MSEITKVNTGAVITDAENILAQAKAFKAAFDSMYETIHALRNTWTSNDGNAYIAKIDAHKQDFDNMYASLDAAADGLRKTAEDYAEVVRKNTIA